jgi:hypothetical protein
MRSILALIAVLACIGVAFQMLKSPSATSSGSRETDDSRAARGVSASPSESSDVGPLADERESARVIVRSEGTIARRATSLDANSGTEVATAAQPFVFLIDGVSCPSFRIVVIADGHEEAREIPANMLQSRLAGGLEGAVAFATELSSEGTPRWTGFVPIVELAEVGFVLNALPLPTVRGLVVAKDSSDPIEGADIVAHRIRQDAAIARLLGDSDEASTTSSADGRFVLPLVTTGAYRIEARSPHHLVHVHELEVQSDTDLGATLALAPKPVLRVTLAGADGDPALHYAAHTLHGTRTPFMPDWTAAVPLDPEVEFLDIAVGLPDGIEITTFFAGILSDYPDGVTVELGAASLDVSVIGAPLDEQRLVALIFSTLPCGTQVLLSRWIALGETVRIPLGAAGEVCVDAAWKTADGSPCTLVRRRVEAPRGRVTPVTIELPKRLRRVQLLGAASNPVGVGEVWFAAGDEGQLSTPGGVLDRESAQLVPDLDRMPLWLHGRATADEVPFAGVRFEPQASNDDLVPIALGAVVRTELELVPSIGSPLPAETFVEVVCAHTGQMAKYYGVPAAGRITLLWFEASDAALTLPTATTWSPRTPVPLTAGSLRIPVVLRAWCAIETGGAALVDLQHVESGLSLADLERDPTVRREPYSAGERWWGIPAGHYWITLAGDDAPRGPFAVAPGSWVTVSAAGQ